MSLGIPSSVLVQNRGLFSSVLGLILLLRVGWHEAELVKTRSRFPGKLHLSGSFQVRMKRRHPPATQLSPLGKLLQDKEGKIQVFLVLAVGRE